MTARALTRRIFSDIPDCLSILGRIGEGTKECLSEVGYRVGCRTAEGLEDTHQHSNRRIHMAVLHDAWDPNLRLPEGMIATGLHVGSHERRYGRMPASAEDRMAIAAAPFCHVRAGDMPGKKARAAEAAETAGEGTDWGDDLGGTVN